MIPLLWLFGPLHGEVRGSDVDAALVGLARQHARTLDTLTGVIRASCERHGARVPEPVQCRQRALVGQTAEIEDRMVDLPAASLDGLAAKAQVIRDALGYTGAPDPDDALLWSLTGDLLRLAAGDMRPAGRVPA